MTNDKMAPEASFSWKGWLLLLALVVFAIFRSYLGTRLDSFTIDEPYHIVAATSYVWTGDFRLNPEHPPLMKLWLGASMPESFKLRPFRVLNEKVEERDFAEETVFYDNDAAAAQTRTRISMWTFHGLLLLAFGLLIWCAAGLAWAAGALAFIALEPTLMAHAPVAMTDLPLALTLGIAAVAADLVISTWQWRWVAVLGLGIGVSLGAKHSALAGVMGLGTICLLAAIISGWPEGAAVVLRRLGKIATAGLLGWILLWAQYGGRFHASPDGTDPFNVPMTQKVDGLRAGPAKTAILFADHWHLLPRSYLWGLADTVHTGVEGRGDRTFFFGRWYPAGPPFLFWPGVVASKVPLFLLLFCSLGVIALWRAPLTRGMRALLFCTGAIAGAHLLALLSSQGTWGGIRHALPLVSSLSILAGAAVWRAWQSRSLALGWACAACWLLALGTTIREPRLWEYSNQLVGGSAGAYRYFMNEGQDLGQRYREFKSIYDTVIKPSGKPVYSGSYWAFIEEQARADHIQYARFAPRVDDKNTGAVFDGYYLVSTSSLVPAPHEHWDPIKAYRGLERVARFGNLIVFCGRWVSPESRAYSLRSTALEEIYKNPKPNWNLLVEKLGEVSRALPWSSATSILLGNTCLKADRRADAIKAYDRAWHQKVPTDRAPRLALEQQLARLRTGESLGTIPPMRSDLME